MPNDILHADMDAFFASVEQRDNPELRGKPVVVGARPDERGVVAAASYEARRYGIHSAMPSRQAGKLCPFAVFVPPDHAKYEQVSRRIFDVFNRFTPLVEPLSLDEAFLDVSGAQKLFGDGQAIARALKTAVFSETGLTVSVGVASNKFLAKLASDMNKPDGLTVVPEDPARILEFLAPLPVTGIYGVGKTTATALNKAGLFTMGDLQKAPLQRLNAIVGERGASFVKELAAGCDTRRVEPDAEEKSFSREHTFMTDCSSTAAIRAELIAMSFDIAARLRKAGKNAGMCRVKLRYPDFKTVTRQKRLELPRCDDFSLRDAALELLDSLGIDKPVRLIGFAAGALAPAANSEPGLFHASHGSLEARERLSRSMDRIREKFGENSVAPAAAKLGR